MFHYSIRISSSSQKMMMMMNELVFPSLSGSGSSSLLDSSVSSSKRSRAATLICGADHVCFVQKNLYRAELSRAGCLI